MNRSMTSAISRGRGRIGLVPAGLDDWAARLAAVVTNGGSVVKSNRMDTSAPMLTVASSQPDATHWLLGNGNQDHVTLDTTIKVPGAAGSCRWDVRASDGANNGDVGVYFGDVTSFGNGSTFWFSYRMRTPASECYQPWVVSTGTPQAKRSIMAHHTGSSVANEIVVVASNNMAQIGGYAQDGLGNFNPISPAQVTACSSTDFNWQRAIDNGASPLSGTNPDSGAAWSSCEQDRKRYGMLYSAQTAANTRHGFGDPFCGGFRQVPDEFITITARVVVGTFGTSSSRWTLWAARDGMPYIKIFDEANILLGVYNDYDTFWLLPYVTNRTSNSGTKVTGRTNNIIGAEILVSGPDTPTGNGTLEYNATTGLFRWLGNGESFGTARGFTSANGILTINVCSGTASDSFVVVRVTPGLLPGSGTVTDSVTIAAGRPDTFTNVNDVIIATAAIPAPGLFAPVG